MGGKQFVLSWLFAFGLHFQTCKSYVGIRQLNRWSSLKLFSISMVFQSGDEHGALVEVESLAVAHHLPLHSALQHLLALLNC